MPVPPNSTPTKYANAPVLRPPFKVNAFIRFSRWSLLTAGILYGFVHNNRLRGKHYKKLQAEQEARKNLYNANVTHANERAIASSNDFADQIKQPREGFKPRLTPTVD